MLLFGKGYHQQQQAKYLVLNSLHICPLESKPLDKENNWGKRGISSCICYSSRHILVLVWQKRRTVIKNKFNGSFISFSHLQQTITPDIRKIPPFYGNQDPIPGQKYHSNCEWYCSTFILKQELLPFVHAIPFNCRYYFHQLASWGEISVPLKSKAKQLTSKCSCFLLSSCSTH